MNNLSYPKVGDLVGVTGERVGIKYSIIEAELRDLGLTCVSAKRQMALPCGTIIETAVW